MTTIEPVAVWVVICDDCTPSLMVPARADRHFYFYYEIRKNPVLIELS